MQKTEASRMLVWSFYRRIILRCTGYISTWDICLRSPICCNWLSFHRVKTQKHHSSCLYTNTRQHPMIWGKKQRQCVIGNCTCCEKDNRAKTAAAAATYQQQVTSRHLDQTPNSPADGRTLSGTVSYISCERQSNDQSDILGVSVRWPCIHTAASFSTYV